jgi:hypothetical protein
MTFENGLTISIQFGVKNYCERRCFDTPIGVEMNEESWRSASSEIAIFGEGSEWLVIEDDVVKGWVPADEVADWIHKVKTAKCLEDLGEVRDMSLDSILGKE